MGRQGAQRSMGSMWRAGAPGQAAAGDGVVPPQYSTGSSSRSLPREAKAGPTKQAHLAAPVPGGSEAAVDAGAGVEEVVCGRGRQGDRKGQRSRGPVGEAAPAGREQHSSGDTFHMVPAAHRLHPRAAAHQLHPRAAPAHPRRSRQRRGGRSRAGSPCAPPPRRQMRPARTPQSAGQGGRGGRAKGSHRARQKDCAAEGRDSPPSRYVRRAAASVQNASSAGAATTHPRCAIPLARTSASLHSLGSASSTSTTGLRMRGTCGGGPHVWGHTGAGQAAVRACKGQWRLGGDRQKQPKPIGLRFAALRKTRKLKRIRPGIS